SGRTFDEVLTSLKFVSQYPVFKVPRRPVRGLRSRFQEASAQENILPLLLSQCKNYFEKFQKLILQ
ncbi:MAG: hypothetical protein RR241_02005, partial [Raoultibacter sp.]